MLIATIVSIWAILRATTEQADTWRSLRRPRPAMLASLKRTHDTEERYVNHLATYAPTTLQYTRARLADRTESLRERSEALFGGISKIGLFPSILAALVAAVSAVKGAPLWAVLASGLGTVLLVVNQDTAATMHMSNVDTKLMLSILDRAIKRQEHMPPVSAAAGAEAAASS